VAEGSSADNTDASNDSNHGPKAVKADIGDTPAGNSVITANGNKRPTLSMLGQKTPATGVEEKTSAATLNRQIGEVRKVS